MLSKRKAYRVERKIINSCNGFLNLSHPSLKNLVVFSVFSTTYKDGFV